MFNVFGTCSKLCIAACFVASGLASVPAVAAGDDDPIRALSREDRRDFSANTRTFCQQFFRYADHDKFIILPNYYRNREASTGRTYDQVFEEMTYTEKRRVGSYSRVVKIFPPKDEARAASMIIPALEVGHYGYINSAVIKEVVGENEVIVSDIQYISPQAEFIKNERADVRIRLAQDQKRLVGKTYRLHGFDASKIKVGERWFGQEEKGIHIAVAGTDPVHNRVLVNYGELRRIQTREFVDVLDYVRVSPAVFNEMAKANRVKALTVEEGNLQTLVDVYKLYYNRFRVPRTQLSSAAVLPESETEPRPAQPRPETRPAPQPEPEPKAKPEPQREDPVRPAPRPEREPRVEPKPVKPEPVEEKDKEEDDWERSAPGPSPDGLDFFGIPIE